MINNMQIQSAKDIITEYLVYQLMNIYKCSKEQAFIILTKTLTYETLMNKKSELYAETPEYVFSMLKAELSHNAEEWLKTE